MNSFGQHLNLTSRPEKKNQTEYKAKVDAAVWGPYLNAALKPISSMEDLKKVF